MIETWYVCRDDTGHPAVFREPMHDLIESFTDRAAADELVAKLRAARNANAGQPDAA